MDDDRYTRITLRIPKELHADLVNEANATSKSLNAEIVARLQQSFEGSGRRESLIVVLDSNGYPQSWAEIREYLQAIKAAGGFSPADMETFVITPDMESSSSRAAEAVALAKKLRGS